MKQITVLLSLCISLTLACIPALAGPFDELGDGLDQLGERLFFSTEDGQYNAQIGGTFDLEYYWQSEDSPAAFGWVFPKGGRKTLLAPRLMLTLDANLTEHVYAFVKFRWDTGIHPGLASAAPAIYGGTNERFDEFFLRFKVLDERLNIQVGQFAPQMGNFLGRHDSWDNPFVTYPMVYENVTSVSDITVASGPLNFANRRTFPDNRLNWIPLVWAPYYAQGLSIHGKLSDWGYAISYMNTSPGTRGFSWNNDFNAPTYIGRLTYTPSASWTFGTSASRGIYFRESAVGFPAGTDREDYHQSLYGLDLRYEWKKWQFFAELFWNEYEVPNAGDARTLAYYVEARYKFNVRWFAAARWGQVFHGKISTNVGKLDWDEDYHRAEIGLGYRINQHFQLKTQYSHTSQDENFQSVEHLLAFQATMRF